MKKTARLLIVLLAFSMLLVSCASGNDAPKDTTPAVDTTDNAGDSTAEVTTVVTTEDLLEDLPVDDYNDYVFKVCVTAHGWANYNVVCDEGVDQVSSAMVKRNLIVEDKLHISIEQTDKDGGEIDNIVKVQSSAQSPDNFDAIWHAVNRIYKVVEQGYIYDLATMDELTLDSSPWWYKDFNDNISIGDRRYTAMGDLDLVYHSAFGVCAFNKEMFTRYDSNTDLYDTYNSGEWTWEKLFGYMALVAEDKDGDGAMKAADDIFGLAMHYNALKSFLSSSGMTVTTKDSNGLPVWSGSVSEQYGQAYTLIIDKLSNPAYSIIPDITPGYSEYASAGGSYTAAFNEGRTLFFLESTGAISRIREGDIDYGIIGYPKYDLKSDYHSPVYYGLSGLCVLANDPEPERTATILENLCGYFHGTVNTAYVANVLYYRYANDEASVKALENAFECGICDIAYLYNWASVLNRIEDAQKARNGDYTSLFKKADAQLKTAIANTLKYYGLQQ